MVHPFRTGTLARRGHATHRGIETGLREGQPYPFYPRGTENNDDPVVHDVISADDRSAPARIG